MDSMDPRVARLVKAARQSFEASEEPLLVLDAGGRRVYSNPAFDDMVGWDGSALEGRRPPFPYWDEEATPQMLEQVNAMVDGRLERLGVRATRGRFTRSDGDVFDVVMSGHQVRDGSGESLINMVFVKEIPRGDSVGVARWLSRNLTLQRFRDAVLRLDGALEGFTDRPLPTDGPQTVGRIDGLPGFETLTPREQEVLVRVVEGLRVTHVAEELGIQPATVRNHLKAIFRKTGLRSQAQLVESARKLAAGREE